MGKNTSIALGEHFEKFVKNRVKEGRFNNTSEVIRAGLRLLEGEEQKFQALRQSIQEGIDSGIAVNFDPQKHLKKLKDAKRKNAKV